RPVKLRPLLVPLPQIWRKRKSWTWRKSWAEKFAARQQRHRRKLRRRLQRPRTFLRRVTSSCWPPASELLARSPRSTNAAGAQPQAQKDISRDQARELVLERSDPGAARKGRARPARRERSHRRRRILAETRLASWFWSEATEVNDPRGHACAGRML